MGKPMSIQWKLVILGVVASLAFVAWIFSDGAHEFVVAQINMAFKDMQPDEQRDSPWAYRWLAWANFKSNVCEDYRVGAGMYKEFCGLPKAYESRVWDLFHSPSWGTKGKFVAKVTPDGLHGWGPTHPYAPEAFYNYLCVFDTRESSANVANEAKCYFMLFYTWHMKYSPDHKPHPMFNKFWNKVREKILKGHVQMNDIPGWDFDAKKAEPYKEEPSMF